jgi:hypothetical protein
MDQQIYLIIGIIISVAVTLVDLFASKFLFGGLEEFEELEYVCGVVFAILYIFFVARSLSRYLCLFLKKISLDKFQAIV